MRIAVTGASGRIGRTVVGLAVAQGHHVVPIDRAGPRSGAAEGSLVRIDLSDYRALSHALSGCDALIHLAAISGPGRDPDHVVHNNNVVANYNALRAAVDAGVSRICQASSVNAVGGRFSRWPRYDYFPLDERHPAYPEDPYSLSKLACEQQADAVARRYEDLSIASLRLHGVVGSRDETAEWIDLPDMAVQKHLWGFTGRAPAARALLAGVTAEFSGHEVCYVVAPETMVETPSMQLKEQYYPDVAVRGDLSGNRGFFDCSRARDVLGWYHDAD